VSNAFFVGRCAIDAKTIAIIAVAGITATLLVVPKNRALGFAIYAILAAVVMLNMIDWHTVTPTVNVNANLDLDTLAPVTIITGILLAIVLVVRGEHDKPG